MVMRATRDVMMLFFSAISLEMLQSIEARTQDGTSDVLVSDNCTSAVSFGDVNAGVWAEPFACAHGGLGCFNDDCRFCRIYDSDASRPYPVCTTTSSPTTALTTAPASTPVIPATAVTTNECSATISLGDVNAGIWAEPFECTNGGLGCFNSNCRFCKVQDTETSVMYAACIVTVVPTSAPTSASTTTGPNPIADAPSASATPASTIILDVCSDAISVDDATAGVWAESFDCSNGGLGCFSSTCRFCKTKETEISSTYAACVATVTSTPTSVSPTRPDENACSPSVSIDDVDAGIWGEPALCTDGGLGCFSSICRYCKWKATTASNHLATCTGVSPIVKKAVVKSNGEERDVTDSFREAMKNDIFLGVMVTAACVGVVVVILSMAVAVKRTISQFTRSIANEVDAERGCDMNNPTQL